MDSLTFISRLIDSLAWPLAALVALLVLRRPLGQLLLDVRSFKYKDFEAQFGEGIQQAKAHAAGVIGTVTVEPEPAKAERLRDLAQVAPNASVLEAWRQVEQAARQLIAADGHVVDYDVATPYRLIEGVLVDNDLADTRQVKVFNELRRLRNKVAHAGDYEVSTSRATQYVDLAEALKRSLLDRAHKLHPAEASPPTPVRAHHG